MNKLLLFLIGTFYFIGFAYAQCGETGSEIWIESEEDILLYSDCDSIFGSLMISGVDISYLDGLENLEYIEENLTIESCISLLGIDSLYNLQEVGGNVTFQSNFTLQNLNGLSGLTWIGGDFTIHTNWSIENMEGLEALTEIGGDLYFANNNTLQNVDGLDNLETIYGSLNLTTTNMVFDNLYGLNGLQEVYGDVVLSINSLTTINGLHSLETVGGNFELVDLTLLANVNGLSALQSIGADLIITQDSTLVNVDSLHNVNFVGGDLKIHSNPGLFFCCGLNPILANGTVQGEILVYDNSINCSSTEVILEDCWTFVSEEIVDLLIVNRSLDNEVQVHLKGNLERLQIYDLQGKLLYDNRDLSQDIVATSVYTESIVIVRCRVDGRDYSGLF